MIPTIKQSLDRVKYEKIEDHILVTDSCLESLIFQKFPVVYPSPSTATEKCQFFEPFLG